MSEPHTSKLNSGFSYIYRILPFIHVHIPYVCLDCNQKAHTVVRMCNYIKLNRPESPASNVGRYTGVFSDLRYLT